MMNEVIARIDISTPAGRKIASELEKHKKTVRMEYPVAEESGHLQLKTPEKVFGKVKKSLTGITEPTLNLSIKMDRYDVFISEQPETDIHQLTECCTDAIVYTFHGPVVYILRMNPRRS